MKNIQYKIGITLFILFFLIICDNLSFAHKPNELSGFFEYQPADNFDSKKFGASIGFSLFDGLGAEFSNVLKGHSRVTDLSGGYLPKYIYDITYIFEVKSKKIWIIGDFGSKSDKPFHSGDELVYGGFGVYDLLNNRSHSLYVGVFYLSIFDIPGIPDIPLPIILYQYRSKNFFLMGPYPFIVKWKLSDSFSYEHTLGLAESMISLKYNITPRFSMAVEGHFVQETILLADRVNKNEAIRLDIGKAGISMSWLPVTAFVGYAFNGSYYTSETIFSTKNNKIDIDNSIIFSISLKTPF